MNDERFFEAVEASIGSKLKYHGKEGAHWACWEIVDKDLVNLYGCELSLMIEYMIRKGDMKFQPTTEN